MRKLADGMRLDQVRQQIGKTERVLVQSPGHAVTEGLFDVRVKSSLKVGEFANIRFVSETHGWLEGEPL